MSRASEVLARVNGMAKDDNLRETIEEAMGVPEELHTSERVKELAAKGLRAPFKLDEKETQELCGSVMRHIERHGR